MLALGNTDKNACQPRLYVVGWGYGLCVFKSHANAFPSCQSAANGLFSAALVESITRPQSSESDLPPDDSLGCGVFRG